MGFDEEFMTQFRMDYLMPISQLLFPEWVGQGLDSHRVFVVKYAMNEDLDLSYHFDNAEVTINVCLGRDFSGGELYFGPMKGVSKSVIMYTERSIYFNPCIGNRMHFDTLNTHPPTPTLLCCEFRIICGNHETTNYSHTEKYTLTGIYTQVYVQNIREQTCAYNYACV